MPAASGTAPGTSKVVSATACKLLTDACDLMQASSSPRPGRIRVRSGLSLSVKEIPEADRRLRDDRERERSEQGFAEKPEDFHEGLPR